MFRTPVIISLLAVWLLVFPQHSVATVLKRQDETSSTIPDAPTTTLEPVLPPDNDPEDFSILSPDPKLNLYYGGVPEASINKRADSETGILVNLDFTFQYPSVPLDYSSFISGVSCSDNNTLTGVFSTAAAYAYGKKTWAGVDKLLLITSADGCGDDNQNDVFLASSLAFSDGDLSFTATGAEYLARDVAETADITWGNVTPKKLRRRAYRRATPRYSNLSRRCITECDYNVGFDISLGVMLADQEGMSIDPDAPWGNAVLLASFGPEEGESQGAESKLRRSANTTDLAERDGLEYGLKLYCVDCGFQGTAKATGSIGINFWSRECYRAQITLSGNMHAGMYLGMQMFVEYSKTYEKDFIRQYLNPWEVPFILEFGPYIRVGVEASLAIKAEGTLLLGASATWGGFEAVLDFLNPDASSATGFDPTIERKAEAEVELSAEATLGLPVGIGLGVTVFSVWSVDVELTDTPALVADATFTASIDANECEGAQCEAEEDEGECEGGIAWSVGFQNTVAVSVTGFDPYEINVYKPDPIAEGCINILGGEDEGGDDNDGGDDGGDDGEEDDGGDNTCIPGEAVVAPPAYVGTCGFTGARLYDNSPHLGRLSHGGTLSECASRCLNQDGCASFSFNHIKSYCRMYSDGVSELSIKPSRRRYKAYYDVGCYAIETCE